VAEDEAVRLERGESTTDSLFWVERPVAEEADGDVIWMRIEVREPEVAAFEQFSVEGLGYREFELPAAVVTRYSVRRVSLDDPSAA
jgi:hypothetical protein